MDLDKPKNASAPYGQACTQCVKAKSRCMVREGASCERCHRLVKACVPSSSVRKRTAKRTTTLKRTQQIEDKLDEVVSLLRTQGVPQPDRSANLQTITPSSLSFSPQEHDFDTPTHGNALTDLELTAFQQQHLPVFPLIYLPSSLSAEQLTHEKPLVASAIKTIGNKARSYQVELSKELRQNMALKLLVDGEKSLDLLLTILVCMTWALYFTSGKQFLGILGGLARSLISDLRFDKPQGPCWCPSVGPNAEDKIARTNESRRAHVACFALSVMIGATFPYEMMQWSPQLEIDCDQLVSEKESEGDSLLVSLARISRICHQAAEVSRHLSNNSSSGTHTALHIAPLIASLDRLRSTFSEDQLRHESVTAYITTTEVVIYELALIHPSNQIARSSSMLDHRRTDYLMACFQACKSCTELFSAYGLVSSTTPTNVIIAYGLKVLHRLATLDDPGWDPTIVHQAVDIVGLLERCAAIAEEANAKLKAELGEDSVFLLAAQQLRNSAPNWSLPSQQPHTRDSTMEGWTSEALDLPSIDFSDEFWLNATFNL